MILALFLPFVTWYPFFGFPPTGVAPSQALFRGLDRNALSAIIIAVGVLQAVRISGIWPRATALALLAGSLIACGLAVYDGWRAGPRVAGWDVAAPAPGVIVAITPPWTLDVGFYVFAIASALLVLSAAIALHQRPLEVSSPAVRNM